VIGSVNASPQSFVLAVRDLADSPTGSSIRMVERFALPASINGSRTGTTRPKLVHVISD
jgi:hypothetical protein